MMVCLQLSRVFSERVFTTNKDVNFFSCWGFLFLFRALHQMPFHTRKSPAWVSCQWFNPPPRQPFSPCVVAFYFYFVAMVAAASAAAFGCCLFYGTDDYVLSGVWGP